MQHEQLFMKMLEYDSGDPHQIQHFIKVHSFARRIGLAEQLDTELQSILEAAAIVHDIGIKAATQKYGSSNGKYQEMEGPPIAQAMLEELGYPSSVVERVCYLVGHHHTYNDIDGLDYEILVEADFLVNFHEGSMSKEAILSTQQKIFKTKTGIQLCHLIFGIA